MDLENIVIFKGGRDGIMVILDEDASFADIKTIFIQKLQDAKSFFSGAKVSIRFKGKILTAGQQEDLIELLSGQNILNISFIHDFEENQNEIENDASGTREQLGNWFANEVSYDTSMTKYHIGMLRSGQSIDYPGSVVVLGDVNPGAIISAGGNVVILGSLKGTVHAGRDAKAYKPFVMAIGMYPVQIGIGNVIARSPDGVHEQKTDPRTDLKIDPKEAILIAYLSSEQIYIEPVDQKTVANMMMQ
ncbi:MAG TPA: hypothetical protein GX707_14315 [Epulopiscium sp.]|nr:hypothetical protein [Candidatus Epulonipiscium sp.]